MRISIYNNSSEIRSVLYKLEKYRTFLGSSRHPNRMLEMIIFRTVRVKTEPLATLKLYDKQVYICIAVIKFIGLKFGNKVL
jgi:hypothetical protein